MWHTFYGSSAAGSDYGRSLAVDSGGNVYVTGDSNATWNGPGAAAPLNAFSGSNDVFVLKLSSAGAYQWHTFYGSAGSVDVGYGLAVDSGGNVYVTGDSNATWNAGATLPLNAYSGLYDILVLKLAAGSTFTVTANANGTGTGTVSSDVGGINYTYQAVATGTTTAINSGTGIVVTASGTSSTATWSGTCTAAGGVEAGNGTATAICTIASLTANQTVTATFTLNSYTVTPSAGTGGSISPSTAQTVTSGSTTAFTVTPNAGYTASVGGTCGGTLVGNTYTTNAITANCTVTASFTAIPPSCTYSISTSTQSFSASGGTGSFNVNQNEVICVNSGWTASSNASWIAITSSSSGTGRGSISYSVSQNTTSSSRTGTITVKGNNNTATLSITQNAVLTVSPNALNYGTTKTTESANMNITITNTSGSSLTPTGEIKGTDSGDFTITNNCQVLSINGSCALNVKFAPATEGSKTATLTITANNVSFNVTLTGKADNNSKPAISVTPSNINGMVDIEFGNIYTLSIDNSGTGTLLVESMRFYGDDLLEFTVTGDCSLIRPQETCPVSLNSAYTSIKAKKASLVITSNASDNGKLEVPISMSSRLCGSDSISISPVTAFVTSGASSGSLTVTAPDNCWWTVSGEANWLSAVQNWTKGSGTLNYMVSANNGAARMAKINIGGIPFMMIQDSAGSAASSAAFPRDVAGIAFENNIKALYISGIETATDYNPNNNATKGEAAAFIIRATYGESFDYTAVPYFSDVPADAPYFKYVQKLKDDNITGAEGWYDIDYGLTRAWAAAFIIRAIYGENFSYPSAPYFSDVPADNPYFKYIQKMKERGFTHVTGSYNPDGIIPRSSLAAFISEAFLGMEH